MRSRVLLAGLVAAIVYIAAAVVTFDAGWLPARPLYDGTAPVEPYRFVDPPPDQQATNLEPTSGEDTVPFGEEGFPGATVLTPDQQAFVILEPDGVEQPADAEGLRVTIDPLDPDEVGAPPEGLAYEGNAYRIEAVYVPTEEPARLTAPATVLLRYPFGATALLRRDGDRWVQMEARTGGGFELFGETQELGLFATAGLPFHQPSDARWTDITLAAAGFLVVVVGVLLGRSRVSQKRTQARLRAMGKKAKRPRAGR